MQFGVNSWKHFSFVLLGVLAGMFVLGALYLRSNSLLGVGKDLPQVFEYGKKTYVRFDHPLVYMTIIEAQECKDLEVCNTDMVVEEIRRNVTFGMKARTLKENDQEAQDLIKALSLRFLPAYLFSKNMDLVPTFSDLQTKSAQPYFVDLGDYYVLNYANSTQPAKFLTGNSEESNFPKDSQDAEAQKDDVLNPGSAKESDEEIQEADKSEDKKN